uniref:Uncharacterized protein n=1 Tax=viral metagenome TaxID=1070528 RepID=A0A6C0EY44_9ZZZZ
MPTEDECGEACSEGGGCIIIGGPILFALAIPLFPFWLIYKMNNKWYPTNLPHYEEMNCFSLCLCSGIGLVNNIVVFFTVDCCYDEKEDPKKNLFIHEKPNIHCYPCEVLYGRLKGLKCMKCSCCACKKRSCGEYCCRACKKGSANINESGIITKQPLAGVVSAAIKSSPPAPEIFELVTVENCDEIHSLRMSPFSRA